MLSTCLRSGWRTSAIVNTLPRATRETAAVQPSAVQLHCSPWVPCLCAFHRSTAYVLHDSDVPPQSVAPGRGYNQRPLPAEQGPCRGTHSAPTTQTPHIVCSGTMHTCKNEGPPPLGGAGRHGKPGHVSCCRSQACSKKFSEKSGARCAGRWWATGCPHALAPSQLRPLGCQRRTCHVKGRGTQGSGAVGSAGWHAAGQGVCMGPLARAQSY